MANGFLFLFLGCQGDHKGQKKSDSYTEMIKMEIGLFYIGNAINTRKQWKLAEHD